MTKQAEEALLRLVMAGGALAQRRALLQSQGDAGAAISLGVAGWRAHGCTPEQCAALERPDTRAWAAGLRWLLDDNHHLLAFNDPAFPPSLLDVPNPPLALFVAGDPSLAWRPSVALVGSRSPTSATEGLSL
uniref:DNA-processing protein DprA n=1 Tax=uncultured Stenotrophomonas sp. TaxID=165438 RepID=UPI002803CA46